MKGEIPVCKRCCICLPLRYGLIVWGYLKLIFWSFIIAALSFSISSTVTWYNTEGNKDNRAEYNSDLAVICTALILVVTDFVMTIVFLIGGHKKNVKLLRVFYFYCIGVWVGTLLLTSVRIGLAVVSWLAWEMSLRHWLSHIMDFSVFFVNITIETYFLILLRSEIVKLKSNCEFRFQNNATEAGCRMKCGEELAEKEEQDV